MTNLPKWIRELTDAQKTVILAGQDDRCPQWLISRFEKGEVAMDEPPGLTERAYQMWLAAGGKPISRVVTADDL